MNYITSCPKCDTQFILTTEHIKSYRGKVQCGSCEHVFNAKNRLTEIDDDIHSEEDYLVSIENEAITEDNTHKEAITSEVSDTDIEADTTSSISDTQPAVTLNETPTIPIVDDYPVTEPAFLQKEIKNKKNSTWLALISFLMLILIAGQSIYFMRTKIAAEYPQFKPLLVQACAQLNCKVDLPKNLNFITISDSDMQESDDYESVVNFSSTIINNAKYIQAYPNIKLTLTNAKEDAVIKKLIQPKEYINKGKKIKAGFASGKELRIKLPLHINDLPVTGYRVQLIY